MEILYIEVEAGFTASGEDYSGLPGEDPDFNDFGEFQPKEREYEKSTIFRLTFGDLRTELR